MSTIVAKRQAYTVKSFLSTKHKLDMENDSSGHNLQQLQSSHSQYHQSITGNCHNAPRIGGQNQVRDNTSVQASLKIIN